MVHYYFFLCDPAEYIFPNNIPDKDPPFIYSVSVPLEWLKKGFTTTLNHGRTCIFNREGKIDIETAHLELKTQPGTLAGTRFVFPGQADKTKSKRPADIVVIVSDLQHPILVGDDEILKYKVKVGTKDAPDGILVQTPTLQGPMMHNVHGPQRYKTVVSGNGSSVAEYRSEPSR